ncbi:cellulose biosynthesis cyclic di-GMP-binding regulatory protein BcsB [Actinoplanes sp. TBRC 11911]|uniref:hypothetical protein n=1 Tax=Actinoplanes sp. TBRC 11911 TaxID=2729386 RepID=UPI00145D7A96|nr:hypothetical protein [Actinoplanes sp. TBRC 11911]NMO57595.1 cellulose biosynthesis cyclic di-GMP-binding regulatory protein BcsB [Actinoplanes sp. TBRC 11911]
MIAGIAVGAVMLLCCGIGVASIAGKDDKTKTAAVSIPSEHAASATAVATTEPTSTEETPTTAPTATKPAPKPRVYKGRGDDIVEIPPTTDLAVVVFDCRCSSNTVLKSDGPESLLVNEIGAYKGKRWINMADDSQTSQFEIEASGSWTLTLGTVDQLARKAPSGKITGKGDDVVVLGGAATKARITHTKGQSNFVVEAYNLESGQGGLLINEIGGYSGTRPLQAPALVQITADGNWSITPA